MENNQAWQTIFWIYFHFSATMIKAMIHYMIITMTLTLVMIVTMVVMWTICNYDDDDDKNEDHDGDRQKINKNLVIGEYAPLTLC